MSKDKPKTAGGMTTQPYNKQRSTTLKDLLAKPDVQASLAALVPRTITAERLMKVALLTVSRSPQLADCDGVSLLKSLAVAAELGLDPSGTLGQGYLVPFKNNKTGKREAQFIPGYRGLIALARRSGDIRSIRAEVVYKQDKFRVVKGLHTDIEHVPDFEAEPGDADIIGAYAVAEFKDGEIQFDYMPRREIDKTRKSSKASGDGPWVSWFSEMAKKTVVRRLSKYLPLRVEEAFSKAVELETRVESGAGVEDLFSDIQALDALSVAAEDTTIEKAKASMRKAKPAKAEAAPEPKPKQETAAPPSKMELDALDALAAGGPIPQAGFKALDKPIPPEPKPEPEPEPTAPTLEPDPPGQEFHEQANQWLIDLESVNTIRDLKSALAAIPPVWPPDAQDKVTDAINKKIDQLRTPGEDS